MAPASSSAQFVFGWEPLREVVFSVCLQGRIRLRGGIRLREFVFALPLSFRESGERVFGIRFRLRVEKYDRPSGCNALRNDLFVVIDSWAPTCLLVVGTEVKTL